MRKGLTLVEILVALGIISILIGASAAGYSRMTRAADKARCQELVSNTAVALTQYFNRNGSWPKVLITEAQGEGVFCNAQLTLAMIRRHCTLTDDASAFLSGAYDRMGLSARGYDRILRVARTIADLDGACDITQVHLAEALQLRSLDKKYWGS